MQSPGLHNAISTCGYIYIASLAVAIHIWHARAGINDPLPISATGHLVKSLFVYFIALILT